jgi:hypothetical protein
MRNAPEKRRGRPWKAVTNGLPRRNYLWVVCSVPGVSHPERKNPSDNATRQILAVRRVYREYEACACAWSVSFEFLGLIFLLVSCAGCGWSSRSSSSRSGHWKGPIHRRGASCAVWCKHPRAAGKANIPESPPARYGRQAGTETQPRPSWSLFVCLVARGSGNSGQWGVCRDV